MKEQDCRPEWRARLLRQELPRARRSRRFDVRLPLPQTTVFDPPEFSEVYCRALRPLLGAAEHCRLFIRQANATNFAGEEISETGRRRWQQAGARPERWVDLGTGPEERARQEAGVDLELTPELIEDELFWWWATAGRFGVWAAFVTSAGRFQARDFFSRTYHPDVYGGSFPGPSTKPALDYVRKATGRSERIGLVVLPNLTLVVVANTANCERLFLEAVEHARY